MRLRVQDVDTFKALFGCLSKFIERIHVDVSDRGIRIRSIDPHDFCYVDLILKPSFFEQYNINQDWGFGLDISRLSKMLSNFSSELFMRIDAGNVQFQTQGLGKPIFKMDWLDIDPYDLPEPLKLRYDTHFDLKADEFSDLIKKASAISHELTFSATRNTVALNASNRGYSFSSKLSIPAICHKPVSVSIISGYLKTLSSLIKKCERIRVWLGNDKPLRLDLTYQDKGKFSFFISHKKKTVRPRRRREGTSLPRVSVTRFPDFLSYLGNQPKGVETKMLVMARLETEGGDYGRLANMLGFTIRRKKKIKLTSAGRKFLLTHKSDPDKAREFIHRTAIEKIRAYRLLIENIIERPMASDEIFESINNSLKGKKLHKIDRQDMSTLLGLATWCGAIDRKLALYYFGRRR